MCDSQATSSAKNPSSTAWKDLPRRVLTISIGVPLIALQMRYYITSWLFFQGAHLLCLIEWRNLTPSISVQSKKSDGAARNTRRSTRQKLSSILFGEQWLSLSVSERLQFYVFSFFSLALTVLPTSLVAIALMFACITLRMILFIPNLHSVSQSACTIQNIQHYQFGLVYISVGYHYILQICRYGGPIHIGYLLFVVWMSDTGALILGRLVKKKSNNDQDENTENQIRGFFLSFLKSISPGKTIPGLVGALITGPISAVVYPIDLSRNNSENLRSLHLNHSVHLKIALGLVLASAGIVGDLAESSVKRMSGKKDSGGLLPGHGGVVDRFDSLFTAGIVYYYLLLEKC